MPVRILTTDERKWAQKVWPGGWADEKGPLTKNIIENRKAFVRSFRTHPYRPEPHAVTPPPNTLVSPEAHTTPNPAPAPAPTPASAPERSKLHIAVQAGSNRHEEGHYYITTEVLFPGGARALEQEEVFLYFSPEKARLWTAPFRAPHITLRNTDDPDDFYEDPPNAEGHVLWVEGAYSEYDGESPYIFHITRQNASRPEFDRAIEKMFTLLRSPEATAWSNDDRGLYGAVDNWFGFSIDRSSLIIWSEFYRQMNADQKKMLLECGFGEVHVLCDTHVPVNAKPDEDEDEDELAQWQQSYRQYRGKNLSADVPFVYCREMASLRCIYNGLKDHL